MNKAPRILLIRRDNIGDLVCATPLFAALRQRYPEARICALVNSYNAPVLENNPDLDRVYVYTKAKHSARSAIKVYWDRLRLFAELRREKFDYAVLVGAGYLPRALRLARFARPRRIIGFTDPDRPDRRIDLGLPYQLARPLHEVEDVFRLLAPLGVEGSPPGLRLETAPDALQDAQARLAEQGWPRDARLVGVHVSARKPSQRWDSARFAELMQRLHAAQPELAFLLFWSPGSANNPLHPGDDEKAAEILAASSGLPILPFPTHQLRELIAGLSLCERVICSDGGAMHLAAGLGKPILCFFGKSDAARWHPWGVPHRVLQPASQQVSDISVEEVVAGFFALT